MRGRQQKYINKQRIEWIKKLVFWNQMAQKRTCGKEWRDALLDAINDIYLDMFLFWMLLIFVVNVVLSFLIVVSCEMEWENSRHWWTGVANDRKRTEHKRHSKFMKWTNWLALSWLGENSVFIAKSENIQIDTAEVRSVYACVLAAKQ